VPSKFSWWKTAIPLVGRVVLGVMLASVGWDEGESVAAVIGGVVIGGSAIPAWYRAKIDRLRAGRSAAELEDGLEGRMVEFAHRQQEQMDRLERMQAEQLADLEERMDFAERLLAKQREQIGHRLAAAHGRDGIRRLGARNVAARRLG
jgi:membrane protein involved in colicin uptake